MRKVSIYVHEELQYTDHLFLGVAFWILFEKYVEL